MKNIIWSISIIVGAAAVLIGAALTTVSVVRKVRFNHLRKSDNKLYWSLMRATLDGLQGQTYKDSFQSMQLAWNSVIATGGKGKWQKKFLVYADPKKKIPKKTVEDSNISEENFRFFLQTALAAVYDMLAQEGAVKELTTNVDLSSIQWCEEEPPKTFCRAGYKVFFSADAAQCEEMESLRGNIGFQNHNDIFKSFSESWNKVFDGNNTPKWDPDFPKYADPRIPIPKRLLHTFRMSKTCFRAYLQAGIITIFESLSRINQLLVDNLTEEEEQENYPWCLNEVPSNPCKAGNALYSPNPLGKNEEHVIFANLAAGLSGNPTKEIFRNAKSNWNRNLQTNGLIWSNKYAAFADPKVEIPKNILAETQMEERFLRSLIQSWIKTVLKKLQEKSYVVFVTSYVDPKSIKWCGLEIPEKPCTDGKTIYEKPGADRDDDQCMMVDQYFNSLGSKGGIVNFLLDLQPAWKRAFSWEKGINWDVKYLMYADERIKVPNDVLYNTEMSEVCFRKHLNFITRLIVKGFVQYNFLQDAGVADMFAVPCSITTLHVSCNSDGRLYTKTDEIRDDSCVNYDSLSSTVFGPTFEIMLQRGVEYWRSLTPVLPTWEDRFRNIENKEALPLSQYGGPLIRECSFIILRKIVVHILNLLVGKRILSTRPVSNSIASLNSTLCQLDYNYPCVVTEKLYESSCRPIEFDKLRNLSYLEIQSAFTAFLQSHDINHPILMHDILSDTETSKNNFNIALRLSHMKLCYADYLNHFREFMMDIPKMFPKIICGSPKYLMSTGDYPRLDSNEKPVCSENTACPTCSLNYTNAPCQRNELICWTEKECSIDVDPTSYNLRFGLQMDNPTIILSDSKYKYPLRIKWLSGFDSIDNMPTRLLYKLPLSPDCLLRSRDNITKNYYEYLQHEFGLEKLAAKDYPDAQNCRKIFPYLSCVIGNDYYPSLKLVVKQDYAFDCHLLNYRNISEDFPCAKVNQDGDDVQYLCKTGPQSDGQCQHCDESNLNSMWCKKDDYFKFSGHWLDYPPCVVLPEPEFIFHDFDKDGFDVMDWLRDHYPEISQFWLPNAYARNNVSDGGGPYATPLLNFLIESCFLNYVFEYSTFYLVAYADAKNIFALEMSKVARNEGIYPRLHTETNILHADKNGKQLSECNLLSIVAPCVYNEIVLFNAARVSQKNTTSLCASNNYPCKQPNNDILCKSNQKCRVCKENDASGTLCLYGDTILKIR